MYSVSTLSPQESPRSTKIRIETGVLSSSSGFFGDEAASSPTRRMSPETSGDNRNWGRNGRRRRDMSDTFQCEKENTEQEWFKMVQNGSKWFEFVCSYCSFGVIQNCSLHTGTVDKWSKEAVNKMNCGCHMDPSHFFLSPQFIANWPDFRLNLNQLFSTLLSFSSGYWATLSMCTDLHCIALRYCVFCHVLPMLLSKAWPIRPEGRHRAVALWRSAAGRPGRPDLQKWSTRALSLTKVHKMDWNVLTENRWEQAEKKEQQNNETKQNKADKGWMMLEDVGPVWIIGSTWINDQSMSRWSR